MAAAVLVAKHAVGPLAENDVGNAMVSVLKTTPVSDALGAEVTGQDLSRPVVGTLKSEILQSFRDHHLLCFRDQHIDQERMYDFASLFGEVENHKISLGDGSKWDAVHTITNLDADGNPVAKPFINSNYFWHTDKSFLATPALLTMLQALELPPKGGDTQFADMTKAYAALPADMKRRLDGLKVVQSLEYMRRFTGSAPPTADDIAAAPPVAHPLARTHPEAGAALLERVPELESLAPIVRQHHERLDGSGYPAALSGEAIGIEARIVAVADVFTAMTSGPEALTTEAALDALAAASGTRFDAAVIAALEDIAGPRRTPGAVPQSAARVRT